MNPVPVSHRGRDVCGFPTGMRRPDPCTTHYTSHTVHYIYAQYTMHDTQCTTIYTTHVTQRTIHDTRYTTIQHYTRPHTCAIYSIQYTYRHHSGGNVGRRRRERAGQVVGKLVLSCCPGTNTIHYSTGTNTLHYRDKYDLQQGQIRYTKRTNPPERQPGRQFCTG